MLVIKENRFRSKSRVIEKETEMNDNMQMMEKKKSDAIVKRKEI